MSKAADAAMVGVAAMISVVVVAFALSTITTGLWYCFDDALAEVTGVDALGRLNFWNVYAFTGFMGGMFKAHLSTKKD